MSHLLAADSRNSKVRDVIVPKGVPRFSCMLPNSTHPQEGNRHTRRRLHANMRQLQETQALHCQVKGIAPPLRANVSTVAASDPRINGGISVRTSRASMQPAFAPIASATTFGPPTDLSMGWDGTLWGIDAQGALHVYDAINDVWTQHSAGIDAAAATYDNRYAAYVFMGSQMVTVSPTMQASAPRPIGAVWPDLPELLQTWRDGRHGAAAKPQRTHAVQWRPVCDHRQPLMDRKADQFGWMAADRRLGRRYHRCRLRRPHGQLHPHSERRSDKRQLAADAGERWARAARSDDQYPDLAGIVGNGFRCRNIFRLFLRFPGFQGHRRGCNNG